MVSWINQAEESTALRRVERNPHLVGDNGTGQGNPRIGITKNVRVHHQPPADVVGSPVELDSILGTVACKVEINGLRII